MSIIAILISCLFPPRPHLRWLKAGLSFCTFHWKSDAERKRSGTMITVLLDVLNEELRRNYSVLDYFRLETATDTTNTPESGVLLPNSDIPHLTHLEHPGSVALDPLPGISAYSQVSAPSQTGLMVIMSHCGTRFRDPAKIVCMLAAISCANEVALCTFEMPRAVSVNVEFYSGALCFATMDAKSVVIQYLD
ncbi:hypothetical protein DFH11DRAFT_317822 [Phellopilus nigrolimitatus]|nr:hypothetical protein DFH11DRAFT_317822 [Phellopilus nigrolimitatus]